MSNGKQLRAGTVSRWDGGGMRVRARRLARKIAGTTHAPRSIHTKKHTLGVKAQWRDWTKR